MRLGYVAAVVFVCMSSTGFSYHSFLQYCQSCERNSSRKGMCTESVENTVDMIKKNIIKSSISLKKQEKVSCIDVNEKLANLEELDLRNSGLSDLAPLAGLTELRKLTLSKNNITDLKPISKLVKLVTFYFGGNQVVDIKPLSNLHQLEEISMSGNKVSDLRPLSNLSNLTTVYLYNNKIRDFSPAEHVDNLIGRHFQFTKSKWIPTVWPKWGEWRDF